MQPTNDDNGLRVETREILRDALQVLETNRIKRLIGDTARCLDTDRVRQIASAASSGTINEQRHALSCARCNACVRAFQNAKSTSPEKLWEEGMQNLRRRSVPVSEAMFTEQQARGIFDVLRREQGANSWMITAVVADELRNARAQGASDAFSAHLVAALLAPVAAVSHDILSPWSVDFDAAWPMFELLRETAKEAALAGNETRDQFASSYVQIASDAPALLRAVLVDGIDSMETRQELAYALARDSCEEPQATVVPEASREITADLVSGTLRAFFDALLAAADDDPLSVLLQLRTIRHYLADLVAVTRHFGPEPRHSLFRAAAEPLVAYALDRRSSVFLAIEAARVLAQESLIYANVLSIMLASGQPELMSGVVVGLRRAYESIALAGCESIPRFEQHGSTWTFAGAPEHPLFALATDVAQLAKQHPRLVGMLEWFNHRLEPTAQNDPLRNS